MSRIKLEFCITGTNWDPNEFNLLIDDKDIKADMICIKNSKNAIEWIYSEGIFETFDVDLVIESFLSVMSKYATIISKYASNHHLEVKTKIISEAKISLTPAFSLNSEIINFLNQTNSTISIELSILTKKEYDSSKEIINKRLINDM